MAGSRPSVISWLRCFTRRWSKPGTQRLSRKKNAAFPDESAEEALADPAPYVEPACRWTLRSLAHWVQLITGKRVCRETVRKVLHKLGHSWKKARKLLGKACPVRRAEFVEQLCQQLEQSQQPDSPLVLFCDEAHIGLDTDLGYGWAPVGKRLFVNSYSRSLGAKVTCFGFYALGIGEPVQIWPASWANGQTTCEMLRRLRLTYPDRPLVLYWDNVSYHRSLCVRELAAQLGIELRNLPPYSPDLMPVERLWSWLRQELTYLHCHVDLEQLTDRIAGLQFCLNDDPATVHKRLRPKTCLDPEEEKLRFSA